MAKSFTMDDLEVLCDDIEQELHDHDVDLEVNLEIVGGSGKKSKILKLIEYLDNRGYLNYLINAVREARPGIIEDSPPQPPKKSDIGPLVSKMCNRDHHVNDFWNFFQTRCRECPNQPQFYFIHGDEYEGHGSFIQRLMKTRIKGYAERVWGEKYADIKPRQIRWPDTGDFETRKRDLKMNLMASFDNWYDGDYSVASLCQLRCLNTKPLIVIRHNIYASRWDKPNEQLIDWYVREYWSAIECSPDMPQFLIFLNIKYPAADRLGWKEKILRWIFRWKYYTKTRIAEELVSMHKALDELCPCRVIEELTAVAVEDVKEWFSQHNIYENEWMRKEKIESIFGQNDRKSMAEIEAELEKILQEYRSEGRAG